MLVIVIAAAFTVLALAAMVSATIIILNRQTPPPPVVATPAPADVSGWLLEVLKKRVIIHTRDDQSLEGSLMRETDDGLILSATRLLGETRQADTPMSGEVFIPRVNVAFAQLDE